MTLDSKIAVVTGSSKGIGKPIALAFAKSKEYRGFYFTWRDNDDPNLPWGKGLSGNVELVGTSLGHIDSVSLIQSNFGTDNNSPLNLEAIVSAGGGLYHFWRTSDVQNNRFQWNGPIQLLNENGAPVLSSGVS